MHASSASAVYYATHSGDAVANHQAAPASMGGALYQAALGPLGTTARYLAVFERFDATGRVLPGWNAAGAFCTVGWMVFRRLWGALPVYLAGLVVLAVLLGALWLGGGALPAPVLAGLMLALVLVAFALPGLYGDALLHRHVQRQIADAVAAAPTMREAMVRLEQRASGKARLTGVAVGGAVLALLAAAAVALYAFGLEGERALRQAPAPVASAPAAQQQEAPPPVSAAASEPAGQPAALQPPASGASADQATPESPAAAASLAEPAPDAEVAAPQPAPAAQATSRAKPEPKAATHEAPARRLYINVGLFAETANARRAHARLQRAGLPSVVREVTAAGGRRLQRVRVGPFSSTAEANAAVARVQALGLDAAPAAE